MPTEDLSWREHGACWDTSDIIDFMVTDTDRARRERKAICSGCPVLLRCRSYAVRTGQEYGVWGGLSPGELRTLRNLS